MLLPVGRECPGGLTSALARIKSQQLLTPQKYFQRLDWKMNVYIKRIEVAIRGRQKIDKAYTVYYHLFSVVYKLCYCHIVILIVVESLLLIISYKRFVQVR